MRNRARSPVSSYTLENLVTRGGHQAALRVAYSNQSVLLTGESRAWVAVAKFSLGNRREAMEEARAAVGLAPQSPFTWGLFALILHVFSFYQKGNVSLQQLTESAYRRALTLNPDDSMNLNNWGCFLDDLTRFAEAERAFRRLVSLRPHSALFLANFAESLWKQKKNSGAWATLRRALQIDPCCAVAHGVQARFQWESGRFREARESFGTGLRNLPPDSFLREGMLHAWSEIIGRSGYAE